MHTVLQTIRQRPALTLLVALLLVGVGIVAAFTGRREPPMVVIWLILAWLVALVVAMLLYARSTPADGSE